MSPCVSTWKTIYYSPISALRNLEFRGRRSFLADFQVLGRFLNSVAAQKVRYRVRGSGMVFNFPVARPIRDFDLGAVTILARAARDFSRILAVFVLKSLKISWRRVSGGSSSEGSGWFLSGWRPKRSP